MLTSQLHLQTLYHTEYKNATTIGYIIYPTIKHNINTGVDIMFKIENEFKNANISRTVRFTEPLFEKLNKVAAENDISFNLLVLQCCKYALGSMENEEQT